MAFKIQTADPPHPWASNVPYERLELWSVIKLGSDVRNQYQNHFPIYNIRLDDLRSGAQLKFGKFFTCNWSQPSVARGFPKEGGKMFGYLCE